MRLTAAQKRLLSELYRELGPQDGDFTNWWIQLEDNEERTARSLERRGLLKLDGMEARIMPLGIIEMAGTEDKKDEKTAAARSPCC